MRAESDSEDMNLEEVNISTAELNNEVEAVDDDQYDFVQDPVENGTLSVKFPRNEVSEALRVGENISVALTGETTEGELVMGSDRTDVIDRLPGGGIPPECPPGEARGPPNGTLGQGPPNEVPGEGPPDCLPNNQGEEPDNGTDNTEEPEEGEENEQVRRNRGRSDEVDEDRRRDVQRGENDEGLDRRPRSRSR